MFSATTLTPDLFVSKVELILGVDGRKGLTLQRNPCVLSNSPNFLWIAQRNSTSVAALDLCRFWLAMLIATYRRNCFLWDVLIGYTGKPFETKLGERSGEFPCITFVGPALKSNGKQSFEL